MRTIWIVAGASFKESVRDRVPYTMVVFAVLMIAASYLLSELTAGQDLKIVKDLGLAAMSTFGLVIAVFIGIGLVSKEVERNRAFCSRFCFFLNRTINHGFLHDVPPH